MVFSSTIFLFLFLPICIGVNFVLAPRYRNGWLLLTSTFFYAWGEPKWVFLLLFSTLVNYVIGLVLDASKRAWIRKTTLVIACLYNFSILFWFKYIKFSISVFDSIFRTSLLAEHPILQSIIMPIGISFFTFQIMSYVIDTYRKDVPAQKNPFKLMLYIMLFPQMIAGPIVRYIDIANEIDHREITTQGLYSGVRRFMVGFTKKVVISNQVAQLADASFAASAPAGSVAWLGIIAYALQIFFDFSAYSDMAIGMGEMLGLHFLENFNYPYVAQSVKDFWRRWHISLSTWFKDYLYIPLGGNRKGTLATYRNLIIVFFVTGFWHGASWNFIVWGLFHGLFLCLERVKWVDKGLSRIPKWVGWLYTMMVVLVGWVFFRADNLTLAFQYLSSMFRLQNFRITDALFMLTPEKVCVLIAALIFSTPLYRTRLQKSSGKTELALDIVVFGAFLIALLYLAGSSFNPFIYYRF